MRTQLKSRLIRRSIFHSQDLRDLINRRILVLVVSPFVHLDRCKKWHKQLASSVELCRYSNAEDVKVNRIGMTLFETEKDPLKLGQYFEQAKRFFPLIEKLLGKGENPIKYLHDSIHLAWEWGCQVETYKKQMMVPGIIRAFEADESGGLPPHTDTIQKDLDGEKEFDALQCQIAANLYLHTPEYGGELEIWDYEPDLSALETMYTGEYDFIDRNKIPSKPVRIKPQAGDLILFRSACIHSVRPISKGVRTAASCFVGYYGNRNPLTVWA